jgi:RimJ/RimL family protein N-acetyltransferase
VLEKAGLTRIATLQRHKYASEKWWTSHLYEIQRDESGAPDGATGH